MIRIAVFWIPGIVLVVPYAIYRLLFQAQPYVLPLPNIGLLDDDLIELIALTDELLAESGQT